MRRVLVPLVMAVGLVSMASGAALAQAPTPTAPSGAAKDTPGKKVCAIGDDRLVELSGMVATPSGYIVVNDSSDLDSRRRVFLLDKQCEVKKAVQFASLARDPEDLALSPDRKTLWIGDTGDLKGERQTIALWKMPADGSSQPSIFRLTYPDGAKDAEALLIGADGLPIIITKGLKTLLYKPTTALKKGVNTPMEKVGEVAVPKTTTANPLGLAGRVTVTGAGASPDGARVVLRTYADAFEWDVTGGDIVAALTKGTPRVTPLPDEPWGESITYTTDGASFLTVSDLQGAANPVILRYTPVKTAPKVAGATSNGGRKDTRSFFEKLDLGDITAMIAVVGVLGVLLVGAGIAGIVLSRRRAAAGVPAGEDEDGPVRAAARVNAGEPGADDDFAVDRQDSGAVYGVDRANSGAVYGAARVGSAGPPVDRANSGAVYPVDQQNSGAVYGVDRANSGAVYGAGAVAGRAGGPGGGRPGGPGGGRPGGPSGGRDGVPDTGRDGGPGGRGGAYGSDRANSGAVYPVDQQNSGAVYGVDRANSGAVYGAGAGAGAARPGGDYRTGRDAGQYPDESGQYPEQYGDRGRSGSYRSGDGYQDDYGYRGHPDERDGGYPDGNDGGYPGDGYQGGSYPRDGYPEQPVAGRRPADGRGYRDAGYEHGGPDRQGRY